MTPSKHLNLVMKSCQSQALFPISLIPDWYCSKHQPYSKSTNLLCKLKSALDYYLKLTIADAIAGVFCTVMHGEKPGTHHRNLKSSNFGIG